MNKPRTCVCAETVREALRLRRENVELKSTLASITALVAGTESKVDMLAGLYR